MSGFFGIFRPQGGMVDLEAFEQMKTAMHREGFDGMETHMEDNIAMGHLMLRVSPESKYDKQPLKSSCGNYLLVGHFRLDYRDELGDKLGITQSELELIPDSQLAMLAYQKWKEKCVHHLEGDWAFILYLIHEVKIIFFKDHSGTSCLAYRKINSFILFSSDINVLTDTTRYTPKIDKIQLCRLLVPGLGLRRKSTLFSDTFILANSEILTFNQNLSILSHEDCPFNLNGKEINFKYEVDYIFELSSIFSMAVKSRLVKGHKDGLFLSSGFDSTAVAYYAAKILSANDEKLLTFTSYPFYTNIKEVANRDINEKPLVEEFVKVTGSIIPNYLDFPNVKFKRHLTDNDQTALRPVVGINDFWIKGIYELSSSMGVKSLLNAQLGNNIISVSTSYQYLNYLTSGKFLLFIQSFKPFLLWILHRNNDFNFRDSLIADLYRLIRKKIQVFNSRKDLYNFPFLRSKFISIHEWKSELTNMDWSPIFFTNIDSRNNRLTGIKATLYNSGVTWYNFSHTYGMVSTDPTSDQRLIAYSLVIPQIYFKQRTIAKYLYRKWMANLIPKSILLRKDRIMQSADVGTRVINDPEILFFFDKCLSEMRYNEIIDYGKVKSILIDITQNSNDWYAQRAGFSYILKVVSIISFLDSKKFEL
jgi:asparagine synthase (glutamine-hydrolysing)